MAGHSIDGGNIQFVRQIGVGTYGDVYLAIDRRSQKKYAVKILPRPKKPSSADNASPTGGNNSSPSSPLLDARELAPEIALYVQIPAHSNIVRLERVLHTHDQIFMLMEYCAGGDLYENISSPKDPSLRIQGNDALIRRLFLQLADAIRHCHNHGVYHRDLKPENILLTAASRDVKLIDFGLATYKPVCRDMGCGSAYYMSPECQRGIDGNVSHYAAGPSDVWSLGIILINLTTGRNPWNRAVRGDPLFDRFLQSPDYLLKAVRATPQFRHILLRVLDLNPGRRCSIDELCSLVASCKQFVYPETPAFVAPLAVQQQTPVAVAAGVIVPQQLATATTTTTTTAAAAGAVSPLSPKNPVVVGQKILSRRQQRAHHHFHRQSLNINPMAAAAAAAAPATNAMIQSPLSPHAAATYAIHSPIRSPVTPTTAASAQYFSFPHRGTPSSRSSRRSLYQHAIPASPRAVTASTAATTATANTQTIRGLNHYYPHYQQQQQLQSTKKQQSIVTGHYSYIDSSDSPSLADDNSSDSGRLSSSSIRCKTPEPIAVSLHSQQQHGIAKSPPSQASYHHQFPGVAAAAQISSVLHTS